MTPESIWANRKLVPGRAEKSHWKRGKKSHQNRVGSHGEDPGVALDCSAATLTRGVTLDKLLYVIIPQFLHLQNGNNKGSTSWGIL